MITAGELAHHSVIENLLSARFETVDAQLLNVVNSLLSLPAEDFSHVLLQLAQLSREELIDRFRAMQS